MRFMPRGISSNIRAAKKIPGAKSGMSEARKIASGMKGGINKALPYNSRARGVILGNTTGARARRVGAAGVMGLGLGANAVVGPRAPSSGRGGIQGRTVGGGRGGF